MSPARPQWVWGIDCGSRRAGVGLVNVSSRRWEVGVIDWRRKVGTTHYGESLRACHAAILHACLLLAIERPPLTVCFERPSGRFANPSLMMHTGAIVAAAGEAAGLNPWSYAGAPEWEPVIGLAGNGGKGPHVERALELGMSPEQLKDIDKVDGLLIAAAAAKTMYGIEPEELLTP